MTLNKRKYEIVFHGLFWISYLLIMTFIFARFLGWEFAFYRNVVTMFLLLSIVYFNLYVLVDKYLFKEKYLHYATSILLLILFITPIRAILDSKLQGPMSTNPIIMFSAAHYFSIVFSSMIILGITTSLKLLQAWFQKKQIESELERLHLEAELKFLKAQVNPHFLFNVLNNIYSLVYLEGKIAAPQILKLSGLMRYMLYESDDDFVELKNEIEYIQNYLDLHQLNHDYAKNSTFIIEGNVDGKTVAPLLFIPFFENAFKHGDVLHQLTGRLHAKLKTEEEKIIFTIENTIAKQGTRKDKVGGIGLENVRKRLEYLYPGKHKLTMGGKDGLYQVEMILFTHKIEKE